jgi:hypothetical protein
MFFKIYGVSPGCLSILSYSLIIWYDRTLCNIIRLFLCFFHIPFLLGGLRGVARGGLAGLTLTSLYALYNNWEHMKGSLLQQSLWRFCKLIHGGQQ